MLTQILGGRYQIISYLGGGGFGTTFVAEDTYLPGNPRCVVKQLKPQATDSLTLQTARRLFDTEAQVLYQLGTHDQIPRLLAYFEENQEFYLVQEFIKGCDLSQELPPGKQLKEEQVISLLQEILEILEFVHHQKVIHRDVNPRNLVRREQDGKLVLIDFGAVKQITTQVVNPTIKTKVTVAIGTPGYVPSEQAQGNPKLSSDIYAVGIIGIQALTGLLPEQLLKDADTDEIMWHHQAQVSPELADILDKMVRYDFRQRYPCATEALQALKELRNPLSATVALLCPPSPHTPAAVQNKTPKSRAILYKALISIILIGLGTAATVFLVKLSNSSNATNLYNRANILYNLKRYNQALDTYDKAIQIRPEYAEAWNGEAKTLSELEKYKEALDAYDKAIQIQPNYLEAWLGRGYVLDNLEKDQEAIDSFDQALKIQSNDSEAWNARGDALMNLQRYEEASESYDKAVYYKPDYYQAWFGRGWALHNLQRYEDAIAAYDKAVQLKPDYDQAWYNRGNELMNLQRYQDAVASYDKAVQFKPDYYQAWYSRGNALMKLQRYPEAIDSFDKAVQYKPNYYEAWYSRGWSLHQLQRYEEAIDSYDKALKFKRNDAQTWYNRGNALYNLKRYEDAIVSYNRAVRYKPDYYEAWYSRGNALYNLKRYEDAIASFDKALRFKPDYREAIDARNQAQRQMLLEKLQPPLPNTTPTP
jgi:tetratricopeptide (TPR) repeat protein/tRNA A-37 threonylcarbamoyl transferase component Bud32